MVETGAIIVGSISILTLIITEKRNVTQKRMVVVTVGAAPRIRVW